MMHEFFAAAISGTEKALCAELRELGFASVRLNRGGIPFRGEMPDGWRACLTTRIAQRIQLLLGRFPVPTTDSLYQAVRAIDWSPYIDRSKTLSVSAVCVGSDITHSGFAALKVKDAICDHVRATSGGRPNIDKNNPDIRVFLYLANNKAALYLDLSGEPLHRRGYGREAGTAPLRETLAATMLRLSGWDRQSPLMDPMCGSGTIAIEAALWSANFAPGLLRDTFGFEHWTGFSEEDRAELKVLKGELRGAVKSTTARVIASDLDPELLEKAKQNARAAGARPAFKQRSILDLQKDEAAKFLITNPPYGIRLEKDPDFCQRFAATISRLHGWRVCFLAGSPDYERIISAKPQFKVALPNGDLKCDFLVYDIK
jgi:23S rRNA G2445 N2-methylase RlmL